MGGDSTNETLFVWWVRANFCDDPVWTVLRSTELNFQQILLTACISDVFTRFSFQSRGGCH